ncbi:hypothetical protein [Lentzea sp. HUAS12]|uniref:hypothetical protein n=1 Tax=Lentzea sp. HUAS12 TaxID=2951806 RepID=UPI0020A229B7|nr:hypothetical protein [Lentzea sp. HUAS12]USX55975.1 hypothetical protein ND450_18345 [Lentzea sp. HUAS12]
MSPRVLELRIHGVNNTPPHAMLALSPDDVERFSGSDKLGSFWETKPDRVAALPQGHPGQAPPGVRREAYSWGGMARSSPGIGGSGVPSRAVNLLGRIGWALLLPFGLANVAYWSRKLPVDASPDKPQKVWWNSGRGAASTRLFGLGLTLLLVLAVCEVAIDVYAVQCSLPAANCRRLPEFLDVLGDPPRHVRVLVASVVPVLLLLGLVALTSLSRSRYEAAQSTPERHDGVMLGRSSMWQGDSRVGRLTRLHLAAGFSVVALVTSVQVPRAFFFGVTVAAAAVLAVVIARVVVTAADGPDVPQSVGNGPWSRWLVVVAALVLVAHLAGIYVLAPAFDGPLLLVQWGPPVVTAALLGSTLAAWSWRRNDKKGPLVFVVLFAAFMVAGHWSSWAWIGVVLVGAAFLWRAWPRKGDGWQAWHGAGPGVLLGLSLTASVTLSTVLVLTFRGWVGAGLRASSFYLWFGATFACVAVLLLVFLLVHAGFFMARWKKPSPFDGEGTSSVVRARHLAAVAHRAENVVGVLSTVSVLALVLTCYLSFASPAWARWSNITWVVNGSNWVIGLVGVAVVGAFIGAGTLTNRRPLGLVWDLMCFLPRAAHPFAPPCYAERAVPELAEHTHSWLARSPENRVVLSAHSLGAVLAVAAIYALPPEDLGRVRLLTYGVQLRPYFGRIFPELLGPPVLGTPQVRAGTFFSLDPWWRPPGEPQEGGLSSLLGANWVNLWRRTDYLGFPVRSWTGGSADRRADETLEGASTVETHSDYHRCAAYRKAFAELVPIDLNQSPDRGRGEDGNLERS